MFAKTLLVAWCLGILVILVGTPWAAAAEAAPGRLKPKLLVTLPDFVATPDGMAIDADGNLVVACPNFADASKPGCLIKIDRGRQVTKWVEVPVRTFVELWSDVFCGESIVGLGPISVGVHTPRIGIYLPNYLTSEWRRRPATVYRTQVLEALRSGGRKWGRAADLERLKAETLRAEIRWTQRPERTQAT